MCNQQSLIIRDKALNCCLITCTTCHIILYMLPMHTNLHRDCLAGLVCGSRRCFLRRDLLSAKQWVQNSSQIHITLWAERRAAVTTNSTAKTTPAVIITSGVLSADKQMPCCLSLFLSPNLLLLGPTAGRSRPAAAGEPDVPSRADPAERPALFWPVCGNWL